MPVRMSVFRNPMARRSTVFSEPLIPHVLTVSGLLPADVSGAVRDALAKAAPKGGQPRRPGGEQGLSGR